MKHITLRRGVLYTTIPTKTDMIENTIMTILEVVQSKPVLPLAGATVVGGGDVGGGDVGPFAGVGFGVGEGIGGAEVAG